MPNVLDNRFQDVPPDVPAGAMGTATATPTLVTQTTPPPSLADRAKANFSRAIAGLSALLGRDVSQPRPSPTPAGQAGYKPTRADDAAFAAAHPVVTTIPNILATVPQIQQPVPPAPVAGPRGTPAPYALNTWLAQQTSK